MRQVSLATSKTKTGTEVQFVRIDPKTWFAEENMISGPVKEHWLCRKDNGSWEYSVDGEYVCDYTDHEAMGIVSGGDL